MAVCLRLAAGRQRRRRRRIGAAGAEQAGPGDAAAAAVAGGRRARRDGHADRRRADAPVEPDVLMTLARACRDHEHVDSRRTSTGPAAPPQRRLEPYQLVTTGRRWYLLAYDRDRQDWRSLRLDRMSDVRALGSTFTPREAPDAAAYVRRSISASPYRVRRTGALPRSGTRCGAAFFPVIGDHRSRRPRRLHRHRRCRRPRAHGVLSRAAGVRVRGAGSAEVVRAVGSLAERLRRAAG